MKRNGSFLPVISAFLLAAGTMFSCKTVEKLPEARLRPMSTGRILKKAEENAFDFNKLNIRRINLQFDNSDTRTSFRASLRAVKDESIVLSFSKLNIPVGRVQLTPDSVLYINYIERNYFQGNYSALSDLFDMDFDFKTVQAIITGNIFHWFSDSDEFRDYLSDTENGMYIIQSEKMRKLRKIDQKGRPQRLERIIKRLDNDALVLHTFYFDPEKFVLRRMILEDKTNSRVLELNFNDFEPVENRYYPATVDVSYLSDDSKVRLNAKMSGISTDDSELLPIKIPEKYQRVYLN